MSVRKSLIVWLLAVAACAAQGQMTGDGTIRGHGRWKKTPPPTLVSIAVTPTTTTTVNSSVAYSAVGTFSDGSQSSLTSSAVWASGNLSVVTLGNLTTTQQMNCIAVGGPVTISATVGLIVGTATLTCTGTPPPTLVSLVITPGMSSGIDVGQSIGLVATGTYSDGSTVDITGPGFATWTSSSPTVAAVGTAGDPQPINCLAVGTVTITATVGAVSNTATVTCVATLSSIALSPLSPTVTTGTSQAFIATGTYSDGTQKNVSSQSTWTSSSPTVAAIAGTATSSQNVSVLTAGTTTIQAAVGAITGSTVLTGQSPPPPPSLVSIVVTPASPSLNIPLSLGFIATGTYSDGSQQNLTATVAWVSGNTAHAILGALSSTQAVQCIAAGTSVISATQSGVTGNTTLTCVAPAPTLSSIAVTPASPSVVITGTINFIATGTYSDGSKKDVTTVATWNSATTAVAALGALTTSQVVTCQTTGTSIIKATVGAVNGQTTLTCTPPAPPVLVSIAITPASFTAANATTVQYTALGSYSNGSTADVTKSASWASSNVGVATIGSLTTSQAVLCGNPGSGTTNITAAISPVTSPTSPLTCRVVTACGPPTYNCSITNLNTINPPSVPPQVGANVCVAGNLLACGNKLGANTVVSAGSSYNSNPISRLTDATYTSSSNAVSSGGGDESRWNTDSSFIAVRRANSGADFLYSFNPSTMTGARLYTQKTPQGLFFGGELLASRSNRTLYYGLPNNSSLIQKFDLSNCVTLPDCGTALPPAPQAVFDFKSGSNCLGASFTVAWSQSGEIGGADSIAMAFGNSGGQGGAGSHYAAAYIPGKGCVVLNTLNGAITADQPFNGMAGLTCTGSGCTGTVPGWTTQFGANGFVIHNLLINKGGDWMGIVPCQVASSGFCGVICLANPCMGFFWQIATTTIEIPQNNLGGHGTPGYATTVNIFNGKYTGRQFTSPGIITTYSPVALSGQVQQHQGWYNDIAGDTYPFLASTFTPGNNLSTYSGPWFNEIIGVTPHANAITYRFSPTFNTNQSTAFAVQQAIGAVSQDGRFFAFSSDWMGTLGADNGSSTCVLAGPQGGTNCRGDVFVVKLQ